MMASTFTDVFGRLVTQNDVGVWKADGVTIGPCSAEQARHTLSGMAPSSYTPADAAEPVPQSVTLVQLRLALLQAPGARPGRSLLHDVGDAILIAGNEANELWEYASVIDRRGQVALLLAKHCHLSALQIDALFIVSGRICI